MLGTPSGCNVFDFDGSLEREYKTLIKERPDITYEEYRPKIAHKEAEIDMGQASPRMFEEAALGTAMVLLEGSYSNVVTPGVDCIIVKRDFSNIDDVLDQISDPVHVATVADAAFHNLIESGNWSYERFIDLFDDAIEGETPSVNSLGLDASRVIGTKGYDQGFLEELSLRSPNQYPMSRWLDLSHLRSKDPEHNAIFEDVLRKAVAADTPPEPSGQLLVSLLSRIKRRIWRAINALMGRNLA
jgi:hypothetical protein